MNATEPARALIFDMDGTIVDNMGYHDDGWADLHARHGLPFDRMKFFHETAGMAVGDIVRPLFPHASPDEIAALGEEKELFYRKAYAGHVVPLAGFMALMAQADAAGVPMAIVSGAPPENIDLVMDSLKLRSRFVTIVSPSQGFAGKPNPDTFLAAAERMKVAARDCLVFEDAPNGIEAARRAGMRAVAILTMLEAADFAAYDNVVASAKDFAALDGLPVLNFA